MHEGGECAGSDARPSTRRSSLRGSLIGGQMLRPRSSGYQRLLAQSGATKMNWALSILIIFRTRGKRGIAKKAYRSPELYSSQNVFPSENSFGNSSAQTPASSLRWRIDVTKDLPVVERDHEQLPDANSLLIYKASTAEFICPSIERSF